MTSDTLPVVTLAILNYQRRALLRETVQAALGQDYPHLDILVVDNASTDGSPEMIRDVFPQVRLLSLPANIGCAARNQGIANAQGDLVITLDNDVCLTQPDGVRRAVDVMADQPNTAGANFKILNPEGQLSTRDWCHPRDWRHFADHTFFTDYVLEGASVLRRGPFEAVGGYWEPLFIGHEGHDLAYRLLNAGYDLVYTPEICVTHAVSSEARASSRIYYTFTRNAIWVSLRHHRLGGAARAITKYIALMAFTSLRAGHFGGYLLGLWDGLCGAPRAWRTRQPMQAATYAKLRRLRELRPSLLQKVKRHVQEQPI